MATNQAVQNRDLGREGAGWIYLSAIMFLFPILFFACVFFPIWVGWTQRFP